MLLYIYLYTAVCTRVCEGFEPCMGPEGEKWVELDSCSFSDATGGGSKRGLIFSNSAVRRNAGTGSW